MVGCIWGFVHPTPDASVPSHDQDPKTPLETPEVSLGSPPRHPLKPPCHHPPGDNEKTHNFSFEKPHQLRTTPSPKGEGNLFK